MVKGINFVIYLFMDMVEIRIEDSFQFSVHPLS